MGGSVLGAEAIYNFLKFKIKKKFIFLNTLKSETNKKSKKKYFKFGYFKIWKYTGDNNKFKHSKNKK